MPELNSYERKWARRFCETCEDGQEYDVPRSAMSHLESIGLVVHKGRGRYEQTEELIRMLEAGDLKPDVDVFIARAQREADEVSALIEAGKRVPRAMTEDLRNRVRELIRLLQS